MGTTGRQSLLSQAEAHIRTQIALTPESVVVIVGPTASGKSQLALDLAHRFGGEIVSADSRLVYREMDIGTAKPTIFEQGRVVHHLLDIVAPDEAFTLADYQRLAFKTIDQCISSKKIPFLVGGTMLYVDSVVYNYSLPPEEQSIDTSGIRSLSLPELQERLLGLNPAAPAFLDWKNPVRLTRALEYYAQAGQWIWERQAKGESKYPYIIIGLQVDKDILRARIEARVKEQIASGLVEEVRALIQKYPHSKIAMTGIGYRQVVAYLDGKCSVQDMESQIIRDTLAYAKRQMTWWRRNDDINWLKAD